MKQQGITRTPLMEMTLGTRGTLSQRMSLPNPQVSFGSCHSRRSGIGKSETAFQQLDVHERKRLCRAQTLRKHQISTAASTLPKTWLSMTINVNFANGVTRYSWGGDVVWLKDNLPSFKRTLRPPRLLLQYKKVWLVAKSKLFQTMASIEKPTLSCILTYRYNLLLSYYMFIFN